MENEQSNNAPTNVVQSGNVNSQLLTSEPGLPTIAQSAPITMTQTTQDTAQQAPMSASQLGLNQSHNKFNFASLVKPTIIFVVFILVFGGSYFAYKYFTGTSTVTVTTDDVTYSVKTSRNSKVTDVAGKQVLVGVDPVSKVAIMQFVHKSNSESDCKPVSGGSISVVDTIEIEGETHNLCYSQNLNTYVMAFKKNNTWYVFSLLPKDVKSKTRIDLDTAISTASSVKVN